MDGAKILVVGDEKNSRFLLEFQLKEWRYKPLLALNGFEALELLKAQHIDLVLSDRRMPQMDGLALLREVRLHYGDLPFVMLAANGSIDEAVATIKEGADDYIPKPPNLGELHSAIKRLLSLNRVSAENEKLKDQLRGLYSFQNIITKSPLMVQALKLAEKVAKTPHTTVAIYGESGTGKEVLARAIHFAGDRMENRFVAINCAGIPSALLESELFGHVKGAFTGADRERQGKFEFAQGGTMLLDEIGDMPLDLQAKLLRVLQEHTYEKLGSNLQIKTDVRIVIATHKNLAENCRQGKFREDLYHRINTFPIPIPPLRERREDIPLLAHHFLDQLRNELGKPLPGISQRAMEMLVDHPWPGNIRELKNCIEHAAIITDGDLIKPSHLIISNHSLDRRRSVAEDAHLLNINITLTPEEYSLHAVIDKVLQMVLEQCGQNKSKAAKMLKVNRKIFYRHG